MASYTLRDAAIWYKIAHDTDLKQHVDSYYKEIIFLYKHNYYKNRMRVGRVILNRALKTQTLFGLDIVPDIYCIEFIYQ